MDTYFFCGNYFFRGLRCYWLELEKILRSENWLKSMDNATALEPPRDASGRLPDRVWATIGWGRASEIAAGSSDTSKPIRKCHDLSIYGFWSPTPGEASWSLTDGNEVLWPFDGGTKMSRGHVQRAGNIDRNLQRFLSEHSEWSGWFSVEIVCFLSFWEHFRAEIRTELRKSFRSMVVLFSFLLFVLVGGCTVSK